MKKQSPKEREAVELFEYAARNLIKEFCDASLTSITAPTVWAQEKN